MKNLARIVILFLIPIFLSGCTIQSSRKFSLKGNCAVSQPTHFVRLNTNAAHGFDATSFTLAFIGKEKPVSIDSIRGSYQYKSKPVQPLELSHLSQTNAVFVPNAEMFVTKSPQNIVQYVRLNYGRYKLDFDYVLNGQTNSCSFNVNYACNTEHHLNFNGLKYFWYMMHAEPGD
ncbi:MAG: hypothetical protein ACLPYZ_03025 [Limisphaerales bacterium]